LAPLTTDIFVTSAAAAMADHFCGHFSAAAAYYFWGKSSGSEETGCIPTVICFSTFIFHLCF
jgi:hypothetical protein